MKKKTIKKLIAEYAGSNFYFLLDYLNGGYEEYVRNNIQKITEKVTFGKSYTRHEYRRIKSPAILEQRVLDDCENTLNCIRENIDSK